MKCAYDFHIHTAASPCGDELMSPQNIVNMALVNELDLIAITDHNTCANCKAVMEVGAQKGLLVIPGMEIECMEEFHSIALFPSVEVAQQVEQILIKHLPAIKNKPKIFGEQTIFNANDEVIGQLEQLLITAVQLPATTIYKVVKEVGGIIYPAHIDRNAYSILSNLGSIPEELDIDRVEVSLAAPIDRYHHLFDVDKIMRSSDAHYLEQLCCDHESLEISTLSIGHVIKCLKK